MLKILHAGCFGLFPAILVQSLLKCVSQPKIAKNSLNHLFWGFKVIQSQRCWHF